jgi:hypothetical protein
MFETVVIDNLLSDEDQENIRYVMMNVAKWSFIKDVSGSQSDYPSFGFAHVFKHPEMGVCSEFYQSLVDLFVPKLEKTINKKIKDVFYTRSFLQLPLNEKYMKNHNGVHVDLPIQHLACVYYVNDTDGDTVIYENKFGETVDKLIPYKRVSPKAGRAVIFDGSRYHCSSQPRETYRCIINFDLIV